MPADRWISGKLAAEVQARLGRGEQSMLFLNRRGFCAGHLVPGLRRAGRGCEHCDARMVEHRFLKRLVCHQCGATKPVPTACPSCGVEGRMAAVGPGVERLAEEVTARFPDARLSVLSSDLFGSARALKEAVVDIAAGGADIIIGTQIVAKGHNFPLLTLVGVIDADLGLQGSDGGPCRTPFAVAHGLWSTWRKKTTPPCAPSLRRTALCLRGWRRSYPFRFLFQPVFSRILLL